MKPISHIRSLGLSKVNHLVLAAARFQELQPAFADWAAGEVYVCKKTGDYRYRFGDRSKSVAPWSAVAREIFAGPESLAFAAMVLADRHPGDANMHQNGAEMHKPVAKVQRGAAKSQPAAAASSRANIIALASASKEAA